MDKVQLRNNMKQKLINLTKDEHKLYSKDIRNKLVNSLEWQEATTIGITISTNFEVDTVTIIEKGWSQNKKIVVPKCFPKQKQLQFLKINSFKDVENSFFNLREPIVANTVQVEKSDIDLLIVPGLVFDNQGYRIGFGGGYFDRFLADFNQQTVSLAYHFQMVDEIPKEDYDLPVGKIINNTNIRFGGS